MAKYEKEGYCPNNAFFDYEIKKANEISQFWKETKSTLGDRIGYMVYPDAGNSTSNDYCYIVDALEGAKGTLGLQVAIALKIFIPFCNYAQEIGCPICCKDVLNPYQIPLEIYEDNGEWFFKEEDCNNNNVTLLEDERYLIAIMNNDSKVWIYLYKKGK